MYQSHFSFDLKSQFINGFSKHRNDWILSFKIRVAIPQNYCSDLIFFVVLLPRGDTSDSVPFADMIPQIHFCYLNCHTDTFNQLLHLRVSRLRSSISYHPCPKCNIRMEFGYLKADRIQIAPCIDSYYFNTLQIIDPYMWPTTTSRSELTISQGRDQTSVLWSHVMTWDIVLFPNCFFMYFKISMN